MNVMKHTIRFLMVPMLVAALSGCNDDALKYMGDKASQPLPQNIVAKMKSEGMTRTSPIMMRIFKQEGVLEIWKQKETGRYAKIAEYKICAWSGKLGPKKEEGDRQAPEGFYLIRPGQMNPNSHYYLSFNIGYPNNFDKAHGRTGSNLMIHGACSSAGCYSMTDENVAQIYAFARDALQGGQRAFQVEAFPFRMTAENMASHRDDPNIDFWKMLKVGYDYFEITRRPPEVEVCDRKYVFNKQVMDGSPFVATAACPTMKTPESLQVAYASYEKQYDKAYEAAVKTQQEEAARKAEIAARKQEVMDRLAKSKAEAEQRKLASRQEAAKLLSPITALLPGSRQSATDDSAAGNAIADAAPGDAAAGDAASVPVPVRDPRARDASAPRQQADSGKKPFWKIW